MILNIFDALAFIIGLAIIYFFLPHLIRCWQVYRLKKTCIRSHLLVLTYDGELGDKLALRILDLLAQDKIKATFFCTGQDAAKHPEILNRLAAEGHEIGCHASRHLNAWKSWPWDALCDIKVAYQQLSKWVAPDAVFRPPYGKLNILTFVFLCLKRIPLGWWTIVSGDTTYPFGDPKKAGGAVARDKGGVVLLHIFDGSPGHLEFVLQATRSLLETAKQEGMKLCRLCDLPES